MRHRDYIVPAALGVSGAALLGGHVALAEEPSWRYCEAAYVQTDVQEAAEVEAGITGAMVASVDGGEGFRASCVTSLHGGLYALADYRQYELDARVGSGFPGPIVGSSGDATAREWRAGFGVAVDLSPGLDAYGQAAFMQSDYYGEIAPAPVGPLVVEGADARDGVSLEAGARWRPVPKLELQGYGRWDSEGAFGVSSRGPISCCDLPGALIFEDGDDFRIGARAAANVAGPLWLFGGYESGDLEGGFVGARVEL